MADNPRNDEQSEKDRQDEYVRGGKGRKDEVGKSGIYPASSPDAPRDAVVRTEGELAAHRGPQSGAADDQDRIKTDGSSGSE
jgi:hypothetical protein